MESLAGKLLIATPSLTDAHFHESVLLVLQHGEDGAVAIILNRPLEVTVGEAVTEEVAAARDVTDLLYYGGPCTGPLTVLHDGNLTDDAGQPMGQCLSVGVCLTSDRLEIESLFTRDDEAGRVERKFIVGYAGWGPGQLEREVEEDAWGVTDLKAGDALASDAKFWRRVTGRVHVSRFVPTDRIPPNPNLN